MDKFLREKSRRKDMVKDRGYDPIWIGIRKNDEYIEGTMSVNVFLPKKAGSTLSPACEAVGKQAKRPGSLKEDYVNKHSKATNSSPKKLMALNENRDLVSKLRATQKAENAAAADLLDDREIFSLSESSRTLFFQLMFAHPGTRVGAIREVSDYAKDVEIIGFHKVFVRELQRAFIAYDKQRRSASEKVKI